MDALFLSMWPTRIMRASGYKKQKRHRDKTVTTSTDIVLRNVCEGISSKEEHRPNAKFKIL